MSDQGNLLNNNYLLSDVFLACNLCTFSDDFSSLTSDSLAFSTLKSDKSYTDLLSFDDFFGKGKTEHCNLMRKFVCF